MRFLIAFNEIQSASMIVTIVKICNNYLNFLHGLRVICYNCASIKLQFHVYNVRLSTFPSLCNQGTFKKVIKSEGFLKILKQLDFQLCCVFQILREQKSQNSFRFSDERFLIKTAAHINEKESSLCKYNENEK